MLRTLLNHPALAEKGRMIFKARLRWYKPRTPLSPFRIGTDGFFLRNLGQAIYLPPVLQLIRKLWGTALFLCLWLSSSPPFHIWIVIVGFISLFVTFWLVFFLPNCRFIVTNLIFYYYIFFKKCFNIILFCTTNWSHFLFVIYYLVTLLILILLLVFKFSWFQNNLTQHSFLFRTNWRGSDFEINPLYGFLTGQEWDATLIIIYTRKRVYFHVMKKSAQLCYTRKRTWEIFLVQK